jgi:alanine dehydrogenase
MDADPLWITERDVAELIDLPTAIATVGTALRAEASSQTRSMDKTHLTWGGGHTLHAIGAVDEGCGLVATKTWAHTDGGATPLLIVWDAQSGNIKAVIEAFALGQLRTGAVSGVATQKLALPDAERLAVIGSGKQALAQVAAVVAVRKISSVHLFSPTAAHLHAFVERVNSLELGCEIVRAPSIEHAVADAQVVTTVTRAREPFLHADLLGPGTHINAVGAITPERHELAKDIFSRTDVVVADAPHVARRLAEELRPVSEIVPLCDVVAAGDSFRRGLDLTVFKAMGIGLADLALGAEVLWRAASADRGRRFPAPQRATPNLKES